MQWKYTRSADFGADQIDVITNFIVITNVVIKRVHITKLVYVTQEESILKTSSLRRA